MSTPLAEALRELARAVVNFEPCAEPAEERIKAIAKRVERLEEVVLALETTGAWVDESTFYLQGVGVPVMLARAMNTYRSSKWRPRVGSTARLPGSRTIVTIRKLRMSGNDLLAEVQTPNNETITTTAESLREVL